MNTTSLRGFVDANKTGILGDDLYQSNPDAFSIQLNAVLTDVTLFGVPGHSFWTQDFVTYYPWAQEMVLLTNVWNFSASQAPMTANSIVNHGPLGTRNYASLGFYYDEMVIPTEITYPFNLTLTLNSVVSDGRNNVTFSAALTNPKVPSEDFSYPAWDWVTFNSFVPGIASTVTSPSNFTANGLRYNPVGLTDDFELVICGPGGGSQVDLSTADATLGLGYYTDGQYLSVPSAFNYGDETGETATGADVTWSDASGGPVDQTNYGTMSTGPSVLSGLWGEGAPLGSIKLSIYVQPANAFNFLEYEGTENFTNGYVEASDYAPNLATRTFYLMPGQYQLKSELTDYFPTFQTIELEHATVLNFTLPSYLVKGVYTPLWAFSNAEIAALALSGTGAPTDPYLLPVNQSEPLSSSFGLYNDYGFPVFPGVFLKDTTASTELDSPPSFLTETNMSQYPGLSLPSTNDLQYWIWNVSGFALLDGTNISGWFGDNGYFPFTFNSFNVVVYASQHDLFAGNVFPTQSQALLLYASPGVNRFLNRSATLGGNNTVWGNEFVQTDPPPSCEAAPKCLPLLPYNSGLGLELGEADDLVYNNLFDTPTTAWLTPLNLYSGSPAFWTGEVWNITPQPESVVHYASGFPTIPLSGSVVGGTTQGGNSWWDYGLKLNWANGADNPTSKLPYDENASTLIEPLPGYGAPLPGYGCDLYYCASYIYYGGDDAPLATIAAEVTLGAHGLLRGSTWKASVLCGITHEGGGGGGSPSTPPCCGPLHEGGGGGGGEHGGGCGGGSSGMDPNAVVPATGSGGNFAIADVETNASEVHLVLPDGAYLWSPSAVVGYSNLTGGTLNVTGTHPARVTLAFHQAAGYAVLAVRAKGLPKGTHWKVDIDGTTAATDAFNTTVAGTRNAVRTLFLEGAYTYSVLPVPGYVPKTDHGTILLTKAGSLRISFKAATYAVEFQESGLSSGQRWSVKVTGPVHGSGSKSERRSSKGATVGFELPNGAYSYSVTGPGGSTCSVPMGHMAGSRSTPCANGTFVVDGTTVSLSVSFTDSAGVRYALGLAPASSSGARSGDWVGVSPGLGLLLVPALVRARQSPGPTRRGLRDPGRAGDRTERL